MAGDGEVRRVGTVTIGQSPRSDVTPDLMALLGPDAELVEEGALNGLSQAEIAALAPGPGDPVLVSRLADGRQVRLRRFAMDPLVQAAFDRLAGRVDLILMLCTGSLPHVKSACPVLYPEELLLRVVGGMLSGSPVPYGVITPAPEQVAEQKERWAAAAGVEPAVVACSPYQAQGLAQNLAEAAHQLKAAGARLIILDCLGYSRRMKRAVCQATGLPTVLARGLLGRVAAEWVDGGDPK